MGWPVFACHCNTRMFTSLGHDQHQHNSHSYSVLRAAPMHIRNIFKNMNVLGDFLITNEKL
jgi:hypothetical protein